MNNKLRPFDWYMVAAIFFIFGELFSDDMDELGRGDNFDPATDINYGVIWIIDNEWIINYPVIAFGITLLCIVIGTIKVKK